MAASYAVSVRRVNALLAASFRFHLTVDTLAVQLTLPPVGCVEDFHLQAGAPCRAHDKKAPLCKGAIRLKYLEVAYNDLFFLA
jgi:hypothetical protein